MKLQQKASSSTPNCGADPALALKQMFIDMTMGTRINAGQCPVRRAVFLKLHGVAKADFIVTPGLPQEYRVGIFAKERYDAWIRFSSDTVPGAPDLKTTVGAGIKLFDVPGKKLLPGDEDATTADFLLQNMDIFFVDTAMDMCEFTYAGAVLHDYGKYLADHPRTAEILKEMEKVVPSCLTTPYWSGLPYSFGDKNVKYKLEPIPPPFGAPPNQNNSDYLEADLQARLNMGEAQFRFMVQFQTDPATMPLDKATVPWSEEDSPPIQLATLVIRQQDISVQGQAAYGENLSFNPWRTLQEHEPQGSISDVRKTVYQAGAALRRFKNGVPAVEPQHPRELNQP
ncbi:hypothetical protein [Paraflavitalea speifideaquila]|uniref:hypothetical protein n=1 Tax=Paraflavitalea speifideaquila TaxID=3076558 RepID=UPI0028E97036|nr:hypothetical protein [Paraflavitalea speifideiaquila]